MKDITAREAVRAAIWSNTGCSDNAAIQAAEAVIELIDHQAARADRADAENARLREALARAPIIGRGEETMAFRDRQDKWLREYRPARAALCTAQTGDDGSAG